jgi:glycosyltransferase involved in cell wall biosynthesis
MRKSKTMITVSVIITTKKEARYITACLDSVKSQTYKNIEIIVVDNHSSDKTKQIARRFTSLVFEAGPERSAQRNFGAWKAKGEYVLFVDADMILGKNVVTECVDKSKTYRALVIPEKSVGVGFWATCKALERACYEGVEWMEAARCYRRDTFNSLGGYDEKLTGPEDYELAQRLRANFGNKSIGRIRSYILHDEGDLTLPNLLQKKYYYGRRMDRYRKLSESKEYFNKQSNIFARYGLFLKHPKMFISDPIHSMGVFVMKTLEMIALGYGGLQKYYEK